MEDQKKSSDSRSENDQEKPVRQELEHDVTVMMNEPFKVSLPYGARYSDLLKKVDEELARQGKKSDLKSYSGMLNNKAVGEGEDPVLIRASVVSLVQKITGGK